MSSQIARLHELHGILGQEVIDIATLKRCCFNGIPDEQVCRPLCWKLMLNYVPADRSKWHHHLQKQRSSYAKFIEEMVLVSGTPGVRDASDDVTNGLVTSSVDISCDDHPLSVRPESKWQAYFRDNDVLWQIDKDVRRLCPELSFFQQATEFPCQAVVGTSSHYRLHSRVDRIFLRSQSMRRKGLGVKTMVDTRKASAVSDDDYVPLEHGQEAHWEVVERILFIFAKLNPGQGYVQGMNEIIGPIYYTFATDPDPVWREHAEADSFGVFTALMSEIRDFFIKTLDDSSSGINLLLRRLMLRLQHHDPRLAARLQLLKLQPQYFAFRWITVMLTHEFLLPDVLRIWDSLFADDRRFNFLMEFCCAMMILVRDQLLSGDFASGMHILQRYPNIDVAYILQKAQQLVNG